MPVFDIDVKIAGTLYIKAETKEQAEEILKELFEEGSEIIYTSGIDFEDKALPAVSLSPAMTVYGPWEGQKLQRADE